MPVRPGYLLLAGGGGILIWASLKNKKPSDVLRSLISGKSPASTPSSGGLTTYAYGQTVPTGGYVGGNPPNAASVAAYKAYALALLVKHGWPNQWQAFNSIVMTESGWNPNATNQASGAYGIAQALGHGIQGTAGTHGNQYGNYGTSNSVCKLANSGSGDAQIQWMMNYIAATYGDANAAWRFHQSNGAYLWRNLVRISSW